MKRSFLAAAVWFAIAGAGWTSQPMATEQEIADLQADLRNLEAELETAEARAETLPATLRTRVETIRDNAIYLKVKMQKHRDDGGEGTGLTHDEVAELHEDIRALRQDVRRFASDGTASINAPVGTTVQARLMDTLGSASSEVGDRFRADVVEPVMVDGLVAIPAGATVEGTVELVDRPSSRTDRNSRLVLAFNSIEIDGQTHPFEATVVDASEDLETGIGDEKAKIGIGAGIGAILGAVLGGGEGAVIGGVIGGAGAILGTEGKDVTLPRGTILELRLDRPLSVSESSPTSSSR